MCRANCLILQSSHRFFSNAPTDVHLGIPWVGLYASQVISNSIRYLTSYQVLEGGSCAMISELRLKPHACLMAHNTHWLSVPHEWLLSVYGGSDMASYLVCFVTNLDLIDSEDLQGPMWTTSSQNLLTFLDNLILRTITQNTCRPETIAYLIKLGLQYLIQRGFLS